MINNNINSQLSDRDAERRGSVVGPGGVPRPGRGGQGLPREELAHPRRTKNQVRFNRPPLLII